MSLNDADPKFPSDESAQKAIPPSPTRENPAGVYPRSTPTPASPQEIPGSGRGLKNQGTHQGDSHIFRSIIDRLDNSLEEIIKDIDKMILSGAGVEMSDKANPFLQKLEGWRRELEVIRSNGRTVPGDAAGTGVTQGPLFTD